MTDTITPPATVASAASGPVASSAAAPTPGGVAEGVLNGVPVGVRELDSASVLAEVAAQRSSAPRQQRCAATAPKPWLHGRARVQSTGRAVGNRAGTTSPWCGTKDSASAADMTGVGDRTHVSRGLPLADGCQELARAFSTYAEGRIRVGRQSH